MRIPYAFSLAGQSLFKDKWINLLSVLTIASGLFIISIALLIGHNMDAATKKLPERFSMMVYLDDKLLREGADRVVASVRRLEAAGSVRYISKDEAAKELKGLLKGSSYIFEGLDENPLPDSIEIKLRKEVMSPDAVRKLAEDVMKVKGVKEIDYGEKFLSTLHSLKVGLDTGGMIFIAILSAGIVFVCYSTVKILFYRRSEEIETFKLLGATKAFIRTPFLIEGGVIGTAGGVVSFFCMGAFYYSVILKLGATIPVFGAVLFPSRLFLTLPLVGLLLGVAGAAVALGRLKY